MPPAQVAHDSMVGAQCQGLSPWERTWAGQNQLGWPEATLTRGIRFGLRRDHTPPQLPGQLPTVHLQQPPPANMRTSGRGTRAQRRETGQVSSNQTKVRRRRMMLYHITCPLWEDRAGLGAGLCGFWGHISPPCERIPR